MSGLTCMKINVGDFDVTVREVEIENVAGEVEDVEIRLEFGEGQNEPETVVVGSHEELKQLAQVILETLDRNQQHRQEHEQEYGRHLLTKIVVRFSGYDAWRAARYCEDAREIDQYEFEASVPNDSKSQELLAWLVDAYSVTWLPLESLTTDGRDRIENALGVLPGPCDA